jgi:excisionase family DNA binding protein
MQYPKPYMSVRTLAEHLDLSVDTIEEWVRIGKLPKPLKTAGKRLWAWKDVVKAMEKMREVEEDEQRLERMRATIEKIMTPR